MQVKRWESGEFNYSCYRTALALPGSSNRPSLHYMKMHATSPVWFYSAAGVGPTPCEQPDAIGSSPHIRLIFWKVGSCTCWAASVCIHSCSLYKASRLSFAVGFTSWGISLLRAYGQEGEMRFRAGGGHPLVSRRSPTSRDGMGGIATAYCHQVLLQVETSLPVSCHP